MSANPVSVQRERKVFWRDISKLGVGVVALFFLNVLAQNYFFRLDLTEENRYSLSGATKNLLEGLEQDVEITVYLEGELPPGFQRLQRSVEETLGDFQAYAGGNLRFRFVDPLTTVSSEQRNAFFFTLDSMGIEVTRVFDEENGSRIQRLIVPGAVVRSGGQEAGVMLLKGDKGASAQDQLNQSIEGVEYELASTIRQVTASRRKQVAIMRGHGELPSVEMGSLIDALSQTYDVYELFLPQSEEIAPVDAVIIAKPLEAFSREDQYKLDQYLMRGGKALFFMDALQIDMDSLGSEGSFAFPLKTGLDDMLFRYGVRVNPTLVQDIESGQYPIVVGNMGDQPQIRLLPWPFFPVVNKYASHPMVRNLDATYLRFASTMDTIATPRVTKTSLVYTSQYSRVLTTPIVVDLNELRQAPEPERYQNGSQPVAYLLEGTFTSVFKNRILPEGLPTKDFRSESIPTKMLVVSDGDVVRNELDPQNNRPLPLGFDPFTERTFANQDFVMNALAYLVDESGLIRARTKEVRLRPLDQVKVKAESTKWQFINLVLPLVLIGAFGIVKFYIRRRRYTRF
uniref:Gliding motility-associated ABC transporter substrate-binding protein GldG n=1 Tax=Roseihalotalea indica TaxID=2867963 RepID=A0AA49JKD9_9BACT|nr:gliding motility-associated ABC transporter substrate-binding protein GldG [Tunicatimonas sp. TK19036]